jgi:hypothetical protein
MSELKVLLGGKKRTLVFKMGTLTILGDITKQDPLTQSADLSKPESTPAFVKSIVLAGLLAARENVTKEQVSGWVDAMEWKEGFKILKEFAKAYEIPSGEGGTGAQ